MRDTFYFQIEKEKNGAHIWKGEDAIPYADGRFMFVADGSGGAGCRHESVSVDFVKDDEKRAAMFPGAFAEHLNTDPELRQYWQESFAELEQMKDFPDCDRKLQKESGYYASRIVGCLLVDSLRHESELAPDAIFSRIDSCSSKDERQKISESYAAALKGKLSSGLEETARNAGLIVKNLPADELCLPTTLSMALYRQTEDGSVDVICLQTGDSRICALFADGAAQLTVDDETPGGEVTNYISITRPFTINARYYRFRPPFILFAVSDGCTDWPPKHLDNGTSVDFGLAFESFTLIEPFLSSEAPDGVKEYWESFYKNRVGRYDDSASLAYQVFGPATFEALKAFVQRRADAISSGYLSKMGDLLETDYLRMDAEERSKFKKEFGPECDEFLKCPAVLSHIAEKKRNDSGKSLLNAANEEMKNLRRELEANWPDLTTEGKDIQTIREKIRRTMSEYQESLIRCSEEIGNLCDALLQIKPDPDGCSLRDALDKLQKKFDTMSAEIHRISESARQCFADAENEADLRGKLLQADADKIQKQADELIQRGGHIPDEWPSSVRERIRQILEKGWNRLGGRIPDPDEVEQTDLDNAKRNIGQILDHFLEHREFYDQLPESQKAFLEKVRNAREKVRKIEKLKRKQIELYREAETAYMRMLSGAEVPDDEQEKKPERPEPHGGDTVPPEKGGSGSDGEHTVPKEQPHMKEVVPEGKMPPVVPVKEKEMPGKVSSLFFTRPRTGKVVETDRNMMMDIVLCVDVTQSMAPFIRNLQDEIERLPAGIRYAMTGHNMLGQLRIKVIQFRDLNKDKIGIRSDGFFTVTEDEELDQLRYAVEDMIPLGGDDEPESGLDAVARAMQSDWCGRGWQRRHIIVVCTDASAIPLDEGIHLNGVPKSLSELQKWWEEKVPGGNMENSSGRMILLTPDADPWKYMKKWPRVQHFRTRPGKGNEIVDLNRLVKEIKAAALSDPK